MNITSLVSNPLDTDDRDIPHFQEAKIVGALRSLSGNPVTEQIRFSLFGKLYGGLIGAALSVYYEARKVRDLNTDQDSIDAYNEAENELDEIDQNDESWELNGFTTQLKPQTRLRQWMYARQMVETYVPPIQPLGETAKYMLERNLARISRKSDEQIRHLAKISGHNPELMIAKNRREIKEEEALQRTAIIEARKIIRDQGKIMDADSLGVTCSDEHMSEFVRERNFPEGFLELLSASVDGAKKGISSRTRGRSYEDITADLALIEDWRSTYL